MLFSPDYDAQQYGIDIVASPRHADGVIVTGPGTQQMESPFAKTLQAVGEPRIVVALGDCALSGHVHRDGYASGNGFEAVVAIDLRVPGCPPAPREILDALRQLMRSNA